MNFANSSFFGLGDSPGNTPLYPMAALMNGGHSGLLHLIHGLGCGAAVTGLLNDGTAAPLLLGQLLFQLGRHDALCLLLGRSAALLFAFPFDFIRLIPFFYFGYDTSLLKKVVGRAHGGRAPDLWVLLLYLRRFGRVLAFAVRAFSGASVQGRYSGSGAPRTICFPI